MLCDFVTILVFLDMFEKLRCLLVVMMGESRRLHGGEGGIQL